MDNAKNRPRRKAIVNGAVSALAMLLMAACGGSSSQANFVSNGTFTNALASDPGNLHPYQSVIAIAAGVNAYAYDSLVALRQDGTITSQLASKWNATATGATFTLRSGIKCSDGHTLTASDVAADFNYVKNPANKSPLLGVIIPTPAFTITPDDTANSLTLTLQQPFGFILQTFGTFFIVCPNGLANPQSLLHATDGTGPYSMTDAVPSDHYTLALRKEYAWGPGGATASTPGLPSTVRFNVVPNQATRTNLILAGSISATSISGPDRQRVENKGFTIQKTPILIGELFYNEAAGRPGADQAIRIALTTALDLNNLRKVATAGLGVPPTGLVTQQPQPCPGNTVSGNLPSFSASQATQLLDKAGWTMGSDGVRSKTGTQLKITLLYPSTGAVELGSAMELLASEWKSAGANVIVKGEANAALVGTLFSGGDWDAAIVPVSVFLPSQLVGFLSGPTPPKGTNFANINNSAYNSDVATATSAGPSGCSSWAAAEVALFKAADIVPFAQDAVWTVGRKSQFQLGVYGISPTSIRLIQ